ncbi:hypothetical protein DH2020_030437 [Rehmannia glutinosa]|uniref:F-box domain-containing protein n=1 Tax=Rehmannia glutinosa TaxID=99300 RepID=A0ABR0VPC4_REHGL
MRKRARLTEPTKDEFDPEDYISLLPDDILVSILSRLTLKEATVTSKLSRRWRYLWTQVAGLDFDANDTLDRIAADPKLRSSERPKYINWVNRVVRQHRGRNWMLLGFVSIWTRVRNVRLIIGLSLRLQRSSEARVGLVGKRETLRQPTRNYSFPYKQMSQCKRFSLKNVYSDFAPMQTGLKCLKALSLKCVNVSEEALNCFLSSCPVLNYLGPGINLIIKDVPMLDEISIGEGYSGLENNVFGQLSCCLYQLEVLTLDIYRPEENIKIFAFPELPKLKQLILKVGAWNDDSLLEFTSLIKACPNLNRFVLQLIWMSPSKRRRKVLKAAKCSHQFLKLVEIVGYYGRTSDAELVLYFIENAVALQKIIIDPRNQILERSPIGIDQIKKEESARRRAKKQLEAKNLQEFNY